MAILVTNEAGLKVFSRNCGSGVAVTKLASAGWFGYAKGCHLLVALFQPVIYSDYLDATTYPYQYAVTLYAGGELSAAGG